MDNPLTDHWRHLDALPGQVATWLLVTATGDAIVLDVDDSRVRAWLLGRGPELEPERELVVDQTLAHTLAALRAGQHEATAVIRHPESTYVVKAGDTLFDVAYRYGFPQWRLQEANPDVAPHELHIGMELTIPSIDILFLEPVVSGKRIEIDLSEQRLGAYEDDALVYDFTISSGMASSPTIPGLFQMLVKELQAYAGRWGLDMPYLLAIYYERPGLVNGIRELPINAAGQRLWAGLLGQPASYGCIILDVGDAARLYDWAPAGTLVRIDGGVPTPAPDGDPPGGLNE